MRLAGRAADVEPVRPRPPHDRQAAGALVAAVRRARVAEQRIADAAAGHRMRQGRGRDELVALAIGEDQHRARVAGDERARLGRRADRDLVGGAGRARLQEVRQGGHARRRHRPGAPRHLDAAAHGGHGGGERQSQDRAQRHGGGDPRRAWARADGERDPGPQAGRHGGIHAGQVARTQTGDAAAQHEARDEPEHEREQPAAADAAEPPGTPERERDGQRRQRGHRLDADPPPEVGLGRDQPQRPGRRGAAAEGGGVLAGAAGDGGNLARRRRAPRSRGSAPRGRSTRSRGLASRPGSPRSRGLAAGPRARGLPDAQPRPRFPPRLPAQPRSGGCRHRPAAARCRCRRAPRATASRRTRPAPTAAGAAGRR